MRNNKSIVIAGLIIAHYSCSKSEIAIPKHIYHQVAVLIFKHFRLTGPLHVENIGHDWIPHTTGE